MSMPPSRKQRLSRPAAFSGRPRRISGAKDLSTERREVHRSRPCRESRAAVINCGIKQTLRRRKHMRKLLVLAFAAAVLTGCNSVPFFSTSYGEAHPYNDFDNKDGSTTIEFKFTLDQFNTRQAMQRIDEFLTKYSGEKGLTGYDVENVDDRPIDAGE